MCSRVPSACSPVGPNCKNPLNIILKNSWSCLCLQQFDKIWRCSACNETKVLRIVWKLLVKIREMTTTSELIFGGFQLFGTTVAPVSASRLPFFSYWVYCNCNPAKQPCLMLIILRSSWGLLSWVQIKQAHWKLTALRLWSLMVLLKNKVQFFLFWSFNFHLFWH